MTPAKRLKTSGCISSQAQEASIELGTPRKNIKDPVFTTPKTRKGTHLVVQLIKKILYVTNLNDPAVYFVYTI